MTFFYRSAAPWETISRYNINPWKRRWTNRSPRFHKYIAGARSEGTHAPHSHKFMAGQIKKSIAIFYGGTWRSGGADEQPKRSAALCCCCTQQNAMNASPTSRHDARGKHRLCAEQLRRAGCIRLHLHRRYDTKRSVLWTILVPKLAPH